jgi:hypothetical protein
MNNVETFWSSVRYGIIEQYNIYIYRNRDEDNDNDI